MPTFDAASLQSAVASVLCALGCRNADAQIVAEHLVDAELAGVTSHGVLRVPQYVTALEQGDVRADAQLTVIRSSNATAALDGGGGLGQVMAHQAMQHAIELAGEFGIGAVTLVRCGHTGRLGSYTEFAASRGLIGIMLVNSGGHGQWVAPFGGADGRLSTNPLSLAVPREGGFPLMLDMATSAVPEGKIRAAAASGQTIPAGWVVTAEGRSTTNPADLYGPPRGALQSMGGHKGFGLSMMIEVLAGVLSSAGCCQDTSAPMSSATDGVLQIAVRPTAFVSEPYFQQQLEALVQHVTSAPPAEGFDCVRVPGQLEAETRAQRRRSGIPLAPGVWQALLPVFSRFRIEIAPTQA